jgi:hypothetical protein
VQETEEAAAKSEAECRRRLRLVVQGGVVELQLFERVAQRLVLLCVGGVEAREHHRVHVAITRQWLDVRLRGVNDRIAGACFLDRAHVGDDIAHLAGAQLVGLHLPKLIVAHLGDLVRETGSGGELDHHAWFDGAVDDTHARNCTAIPIVVRIEDQCTQRRIRIAARRGDSGHDRLEELRDADAFLGTHEQDVVGIRTDEIVNFLLASLRLGTRQVDLVEDRNDLEAGVEREKQIRQRLRLNSLRRIDDEDRALAGGKRA